MKIRGSCIDVTETCEETEESEWTKGYSNIFDRVEMVVSAVDTAERVRVNSWSKPLHTSTTQWTKGYSNIFDRVEMVVSAVDTAERVRVNSWSKPLHTSTTQLTSLCSNVQTVYS